MRSNYTNFTVGNYAIVSQDPSAVPARLRAYSEKHWLPQFLRFWRDLERVTGYRWKSTSYFRDSPSHKRGESFDLAPDIAPNAQHAYAVYQGSDPVLYKRGVLIRQLQSLKNKRYSPDNDLGIFIEPDHLHIQVLARSPKHRNPVMIAKYKVPKPIFNDTAQRMELPMLN